ncbi:hypothetical protein EXA20_17150 [Vibrio cincinnatiensis]|uniref:hypothetical protein n=1 Tax=Vibrio cincinnatiensis TaxID=675 RepID=UPI001EDF56AB|nr:hypothetical protein [Vibrio cincinnatiensis]MCG3738076.1 hypothetical protein [Vibrio cincinnatiensis]MCG3748685.1 hypothetical protein [Vibrio cincinnatiensis]
MKKDQDKVILLKKRSDKEKMSEKFLKNIGNQEEPDALASGGGMDYLNDSKDSGKNEKEPK